MEATIRQAISDFEARPAQSARAMRVLFEQDPQGFFERSLPLLRQEPASPGFNYLLTILLSNGLLFGALCDPEVFTLEQASRIAKWLIHVDSRFDVRLVQSLLPNNGNTSSQQLERVAGTSTGMRLLDILGEISDGTHITSTTAQLLAHPNSHIRSKAALLIGRSNKNHKWVGERLAETDPRVRANAVESLWGSDTPGCRDLFWTALGDEDNRVVGNAALGLYRLGDPASVGVILQLLLHPEPSFRGSSVWVMGETGDPRFIPIISKLINGSVKELRGNALRAIAKLKKAAMKRSAAPPLNLFVGRPHRAGDAWVEFVAAIRCPLGQQLPTLNATNFAITQNSQLIRDYTVRQRGKNEPLAIALALPRYSDRRSRPQEILELAVERALRQKRKCDVWMILKYITSEQQNVWVLGSGDEDLSSLRMRFTNDAEEIEDAGASPGTRLGCASDPLQATRALTEAVSQIRAARNIIFICQSEADTLNSGMIDMISTAQRSNVAIHVISSWPNENVNELCARTGGMLVTPSSPDEIPEALETICASLLNSFEVRFKPETPEPSKIHLQIYTSSLTGEGCQTLA